MIFNDQNIEIEKVEASYIVKNNSSSTCIDIYAKNSNSISFMFNNKEFDPRKLELNKTVSIVKEIYWDVDFNTNDGNYVFDITKDKINLTRLEDNIFQIDVYVNNPDIIFSQSDNSFKNLTINTKFSFIYE